MRKLVFFSALVVFCLFLTSCLDDENEDKEEIIEMTIYPETGYGAGVMNSYLLTQPLMFSEGNDSRKQMLVDIITEGFDFDYERGYKFTLKVKKVWMHEPPQDVSSIKYVFIKLLSKEKVVTEDSETNIELFVSSKTIKFTPKYPSEYVEDGSPKIYDALRAKETGSDDTWMALTEIEGFDYEEGYEYVLNVKKVIQADPYSVKYVLLNILSKSLKDNNA